MPRSRSRSPSRTRSRSKTHSPKPIAPGRNTNSNDTDAMRRRVFIGNLNTERTSKEEIMEICEKFGGIESCSLHKNFGFVQFQEDQGADECVKEMHGKTLFGKRIGKRCIIQSFTVLLNSNSHQSLFFS